MTNADITSAGLILEGGGMRGIYTAGVLDFFLEKEILFSHIYGVSAGACHACSYLSGQAGRARRISLDYLQDRQYCSLYSLLKTGDLFGAEMCYDRIPNQLDPYDYGAFLQYAGRFFAVVTNCESGKAEYLQIKDLRSDIAAVRASSSLPLVSRMVEIGSNKYLDGGISDPLPLLRAIADGNEKNVIILTREAGYQKRPNSFGKVFKSKYKDYPKLTEAILTRHIQYNQMLEKIDREEAADRLFVIRPSTKPEIGRVEKNKSKLQALYELGYQDGAASYGRLKRFIADIEVKK